MIDIVAIAALVDHLAAIERDDVPSRIHGRIVDAIDVLEQLHLEVTGDFAPRPRAQDCFQD